MKELLDIHIYTPEGVVFQGKAVSAKFPGAKGSFAVLPLHAPIISLLTEGKIVLLDRTYQGPLQDLERQICLTAGTGDQALGGQIHRPDCHHC